MKIKLTQALVNKYQIPADLNVRQQELVDDGGSTGGGRTGLYLLVLKSGMKTYYLRYRSAQNGNRTTHFKLGRASDITLEQARHKVKLLRAEIAQGRDPQSQVKEKRGEMTYAEAMEEFFLPDAMQRLRRPEYYRQLYENRIKAEIGHKKLNSVTRADAHAFHSRLGNEVSAAYANRHLQIIKASYNFFINVLEIATIRNPCVGQKLYDEVAKDRILSTEELARLMPVLMNAEGAYEQPARIIRMLLATALRSGECFKLRWDQVDLENRRLYIESSSSKNKRSDAIPLNEAAIQVLSECSKETGGPFFSHASGKPPTTIRKAFRTLLSRAGIEGAGIEGVTVHDLRRTAGSMILNAGGTLLEVQRLLRHSSPVVTEKHYARLTTQTLQKASDSISEQLLRAAGGDG
jgi:integrase